MSHSRLLCRRSQGKDQGLVVEPLQEEVEEQGSINTALYRIGSTENAKSFFSHNQYL